MTGSWKGRGNQYIQFVRVLYCKLPTNGKQLPAFPLEAVPGTEPRPQRWEERVLIKLNKLFILKINSIADVIPASFEKSLFVDDFSITCRGHGGRVVTLSPPTSEAGVRSPHGLKWESW